MVNDNKQPDWKRGNPGGQLGVPKYHSGGNKSINRLKQLQYDPIGELVATHNKLKAELERQEQIRDGVIVELTATGKPKAYRAEVHHALYDKVIAISEKLLRYNYGRVPELNVVESRVPQPMVVNLTKKGDTYVINNEMPDGDFDDDNE